MSSAICKSSFACALVAVVCSAFLILPSCGGNDLLGSWLPPTYPTHRLPGSFVSVGHYWPQDADFTKSTALIFYISVDEPICSHENSAGVPVPDSILFYPDGKEGELPAIEIDLNTGSRHTAGQHSWTEFRFTYEYPNRRAYFPVVIVEYDGKTDMGRDIVDFTG